ncbi:hypothetical protein NN561_010083 [Cricetulus griseus]
MTREPRVTRGSVMKAVCPMLELEGVNSRMHRVQAGSPAEPPRPLQKALYLCWQRRRVRLGEFLAGQGEGPRNPLYGAGGAGGEQRRGPVGTLLCAHLTRFQGAKWPQTLQQAVRCAPLSPGAFNAPSHRRCSAGVAGLRFCFLGIHRLSERESQSCVYTWAPINSARVPSRRCPSWLLSAKTKLFAGTREPKADGARALELIWKFGSFGARDSLKPPTCLGGVTPALGEFLIKRKWESLAFWP